MAKKEQNHGERAHAVLSASGAERWLACPGSVALSEQAPEQVDSEYSKEGTLAHECLEFLLKNRTRLKAAVKMAAKTYPKDMIEHCLACAKYAIKRSKELVSPEFLVETKVDLSFVDEGMFGTLDITLAEEFGRLIVIDFKYGAGHVVEPDENPQLLYYALGTAHTYDFNFSDVELVVYQPRAYHESGETVRSWVTDVDTLKRWQWVFTDGAKDTKDPRAPLVPGDHCKWCPAVTICPELSTRALTDARIDFDDDLKITDMPVPAKVAINDLPNLLKAADKLDTFIKALRAHAFDVLKRGEKIEGYKLVASKATRKWADMAAAEADAKRKFGSIAFSEPCLLSPAQIEKKCKPLFQKGAVTTWVNKRTIKQSAGVTIAKASDKRPAVNPAADDFPDTIDCEVVE